LETEGFQWGAASLSPDGRRVAYQHSEGNLQELRVADLSGRSSTLVKVDRTGRFEPAWSPDGRQLVYVGFTGMSPSLYGVDLETGQGRKIVDASPRWMPRPHFSADGSYIYYTDRNQVHRYSVKDGESEAITQLVGGHVADGTTSPDSQWLAFRRNEEVWVARLGEQPVTDEAAFRLSDDGGLNFSFAPDSRAVIYATGANVWHHPLDGSERTEIPVELDLPAAAPEAMLVRNVQLLDFDAGGFTDATSLFIEQGRIRWIGPESGHVLPADVKVLDAQGRYAIPGLFDSHTHVATPIHFNPARDVSHMASNIAFGVTSVRDMGSDITLVKAWADRRESYGAPVPRIFSGGAMIEANGTFFHGGSFFVETEEGARELVRKEKRDGAVAIKSYFTLPWPLHRAIAAEARRQNIPVVAHGLIFREMVMGPVLGRASIEHQPSPIRLYRDVLQLLAETGTRWCPTIAPIGGNGILFAQQPHLLSDPRLRAFTSQGDYALAEEGALDPEVLGRAYSDLLVSIKQAHDMGVSVLAGTDALNPNVFYGHGLHMELRHLARAGIPPLDVLRLATKEAAATVGAGDVLGTLEPDKLADIVLLDENPLEDIGNTLTIWRVILAGRVFVSEPGLAER
jgi:imidazolonepropionase-like amidohydrolase